MVVRRRGKEVRQADQKRRSEKEIRQEGGERKPMVPWLAEVEAIFKCIVRC